MKFCDDYIKDVQKLTAVIGRKYPTLNTQQHTLMANDIRKAYAIESNVNFIAEGVESLCQLTEENQRLISETPVTATGQNKAEIASREM